MFVHNEEELGNAIKQDEEFIELDGKLASHVKKLIKINAVLWVFCLAALSVVIISVMQMPVSAGMTGITGIAAGTSAVSILGADTVITAVSIAIAGGGIHTLKKLRNYRLSQGKNGKVIIYLIR